MIENNGNDDERDIPALNHFFNCLYFRRLRLPFRCTKGCYQGQETIARMRESDRVEPSAESLEDLM